MAIEREQETIQPHHGGVGRDTKSLGDRRRSRPNRDALLSLAQQDAVQLRQRDNTVLDAFFLQQSRKQRGGERRLLEHEREIAVQANAANAIDTIACSKVQSPTLLVIGWGLDDLNGLGVPTDRFAVGGTDPAKARGKCVRGLVVDECAAALLAREHALDLQEVERLADGARAQLELACEIDFVGDRGTRLPFAVADPLDHCIAHPQVKRFGEKSAFRQSPIARHAGLRCMWCRPVLTS